MLGRIGSAEMPVRQVDLLACLGVNVYVLLLCGTAPVAAVVRELLPVLRLVPSDLGGRPGRRDAGHGRKFWQR